MSRTFRVSLWIHRWASIIVLPFFFMLCLTGTYLIFHDEIDEALGYTPTVDYVPGTPFQPLQALMQSAMQAAPTLTPKFIYGDPSDEEMAGKAIVLLGARDDKLIDRGTYVYVDGVTGKVLPSPPLDQTPTAYIYHIHADWLLGRPGKLIGGAIGLLMVLSLASGLIIYAPFARRVLFGVVRRGKGSRVSQLDLHNLIGVAVFGWITVVSVTGLCLAFGTLANEYWQNHVMPEVAAAAPSTPLGPASALVTPDRAKATAESLRPGWIAKWIVYPGTEFSTSRHYNVVLYGPAGIQKRLKQSVMIDAESGEASRVLEHPLYLQAMNIAEPLHFGDYGGLPLRIAWTVFAWLTLYVTLNGAWLWWVRRRRTASQPSTFRLGLPT